MQTGYFKRHPALCHMEAMRVCFIQHQHQRQLHHPMADSHKILQHTSVPSNTRSGPMSECPSAVTWDDVDDPDRPHAVRLYDETCSVLFCIKELARYGSEGRDFIRNLEFSTNRYFTKLSMRDGSALPEDVEYWKGKVKYIVAELDRLSEIRDADPPKHLRNARPVSPNHQFPKRFLVGVPDPLVFPDKAAADPASNVIQNANAAGDATEATPKAATEVETTSPHPSTNGEGKTTENISAEEEPSKPTRAPQVRKRKPTQRTQKGRAKNTSTAKVTKRVTKRPSTSKKQPARPRAKLRKEEPQTAPPLRRSSRIAAIIANKDKKRAP